MLQRLAAGDFPVSVPSRSPQDPFGPVYCDRPTPSTLRGELSLTPAPRVMRASCAALAASRAAPRGWSGFRLRALAGGGTRVPGASRQLRDTSLNAALRECEGVPGRALSAPFALLDAAGKQFTPDPRLLAQFVARAAAEANAHPPVAAFGAAGADAAVEAFARIVDSGIARPSPPLLAAVAREAARDPVAERRGARVLSVIARLRSLKIVPTPELIFACFATAVLAVDLQLVAALHNFALANELCSLQTPVSRAHLAVLRRSALPGDTSLFVVEEEDDKVVSGKGTHGARRIPSALTLYNGVLRTAVFTPDHQVAAAAFRELHARGVGVNADTLALLAALHANLDDAPGARDIVSGLRETGEKVPSVAYAALVRFLGRKRDFAAARAFFDEWELGHGGDFWDLLSSPCKPGLFEGGRVSAKTVASAGDCVVLSVFFAGRAAADAKGIVLFVEHLEKAYGYKCSSFVESIVVETCWRAGRQDLAKQVRAKSDEQAAEHVKSARKDL